VKESEVAILLALANGHDQRQGLDDVKVRAWFTLIQQEAPDMQYDFANKKINEHYGRTTDMLMPAHLVTAWKNYRRTLMDQHSLPTAVGVPMPDWFKQQMKRS
jgi:hypothetical protein